MTKVSASQSPSVTTQRSYSAQQTRDPESASKFRDSLGRTGSEQSAAGAESGSSAFESVQLQQSARSQVQDRGSREGAGNRDGRGDDDKPEKKSSEGGKRRLRAGRRGRLVGRKGIGVKGWGAKGPGGRSKHPVLRGPMSGGRGIRGGGHRLPRSSRPTVRGDTPFKRPGVLHQGLAGKGPKKPLLGMARTVGSRGLLPKQLLAQAGGRRAALRTAMSAQRASKRSLFARPLRTSPPSPGAPLPAGFRRGAKKNMPQLRMQAHSKPLLGPRKIDLEAQPRVGDVVSDAALTADKLEDSGQGVGENKEASPVVEPNIVPPSQVEFQSRVERAESVQQTQRMSQAEIKEIVRKVENMVSNVRLRTTVKGGAEMSLTMSSGRLEGIELSIKVGKDGKLDVSFTADAADARNLLTENVKELEKALQAKGLEVNRLDVGSDVVGRQNFSDSEQGQNAETSRELLEQVADQEAEQAAIRDPRFGPPGRPGARRGPVGPAGAIPGSVRGLKGGEKDSATYVA